jgi:hypothetical protein
VRKSFGGGGRSELPLRPEEVNMSDRKDAPEVIHRSDHVDDDIPKFVLGWWGWASPIGLGLFLIALAIVAVLVRFAIVGIK